MGPYAGWVDKQVILGVSKPMEKEGDNRLVQKEKLMSCNEAQQSLNLITALELSPSKLPHSGAMAWWHGSMVAW